MESVCEDTRPSRSSRWEHIRFYAVFLWRSSVLKRTPPLVYGVALTDRCNLSCRGCRVSHAGRPDMTWEQVVGAMKQAWRRGFRELYFSGGEPTLWRDSGHTMEDAIAEARRIGFFHVHIYTNGLLGLESTADLVWVSMDGLPDTFALRRGDHFAQVEQAVRARAHPKVAIIYVVDRDTADGITPFLRWVRETAFPVLGVMFYFHTPYYGLDRLFLTSGERAPLIDRLLACKRDGLPVLNSRAGLLALQSGRWPRRLPAAAVVDVAGESVCCRASAATCEECGYAACTELAEMQRLRPSALLGMTRYW